MHDIVRGTSLEGSAITSLPLCAKIQRDVESLKRYARFVITVEDDRSIHVTNNHRLVLTQQPMVPLIVVIAQAPSSVGSLMVPVLEIGYKRARPYRRVQHTTTRELLLQNRSDSYHLSVEQFCAVYPTLLQCLEAVLTETRARWKSDGPWVVNDRAYERGVQITVRHSDALLCQALLLESLSYFRIAHGKKWVPWLNYKLQYSLYNRYSLRQYGPNVRTVSESILRSQFSTRPFWTEAVLRCVKKRMLVENALLDLHGFRNE